MTRTLQMVFRNHEGRNVTVSVVDARPDLEAADVEHVMNNIISRNIFLTTGGELEEPVRAQVVTRAVESLVEF